MAKGPKGKVKGKSKLAESEVIPPEAGKSAAHAFSELSNQSGI